MPFRILFIYTGGTIGSVGKPLAPLDGPGFRECFDALITPTIRRKYPDVEVSHCWLDPSLDSTNLVPSDWPRIARMIVGEPGDAATYDRHDAFIILHGTDTMAWTASALSYLFTAIGRDGDIEGRLQKPVIVTGSQLPLFDRETPGEGPSVLFATDALRNVLGAVAAARAGLPEVGLFFGDRLFRGNRTMKGHSSDFAAFSSPNAPPLARMGMEFTVDGAIAGTADAASPDASNAASTAVSRAETLTCVQAQVRATATFIAGAEVPIIPAFPASSPAIFENLLRGVLQGDGARVGGLVLAGYGAGNFPSGSSGGEDRILAILRAAHEEGLVIVAATQVLGGAANATTYAAGAWLADAGAIGSGDMTLAATQAKLLILLALAKGADRGWGQADVERLMLVPVAGELTPAR